MDRRDATRRRRARRRSRDMPMQPRPIAETFSPWPSFLVSMSTSSEIPAVERRWIRPRTMIPRAASAFDRHALGAVRGLRNGVGRRVWRGARGGITFDVVVIGAGAAGMMCAATPASAAGACCSSSTTRSVGEKIRISGGGRCNFTNLHARTGELPVAQPRLLPLGARALHAARLHRARRAPRHRLPREDARPALLRRAARRRSSTMLQRRMRGGRRRVAAAVRGRRRRAARRRLHHRDAARRRVRARVARDRDRRPHGAEDRRDAVRATGSPSSSASRVVPPRPALVPLASRPTCSRATATSRACRSTRRSPAATGAFARTCCSRIAGCPARRSCRSRRTGTARAPLAIDLLPGLDVARVAARASALRARVSTRCSPSACRKRFAQQWCEAHGSQRPMAQLSDARARRGRRGARSDWQVQPSGTLGYNKAEVTLGGVDTRGAVVEDDGGHRGAGPLFHRRGASTSPATSAASTSSGRGRPGTRRDRLPDALKTNADVRQRKASAASRSAARTCRWAPSMVRRIRRAGRPDCGGIRPPLRARNRPCTPPTTTASSMRCSVRPSEVPAGSPR